MLRILLACGQGFSSGFIASSMRKACKSKLIEAEVQAVGDIQIPESIEKKTSDIILIGPHIKYKLEEFQQLAEKNDNPVKIAVMDQKNYSMMNGAAILKDALELLDK